MSRKIVDIYMNTSDDADVGRDKLKAMSLGLGLRLGGN